MRTELVDNATKNLVINTQTGNTDHALTNLECHTQRDHALPDLVINTHTDHALTNLEYYYPKRPCRPCIT